MEKSVKLIKLEDGSYIITFAAVLNHGELILCDHESVIMPIDPLAIWSECISEWHQDTRGPITIRVNGSNLTVPDPMWREILEETNDIACNIIDGA